MPRPERYDSAADAVADIPDGASILVAGFHAGVPWNLMQALWEQGATDLTAISTTVNRPLLDEDGRVTIADLVLAGRVRKVIASFTAAPHPSQPNEAERVFREGGAEAELVPQGTVAERIRAGGAGIPAFYTPAGVGSVYAEGREQRTFDGRSYVLEHGITADYAFVRAHQADEAGNLVFRRAARTSTRSWPPPAAAPSPRWTSRSCRSARSTRTRCTRPASTSHGSCTSPRAASSRRGARGAAGAS